LVPVDWDALTVFVILGVTVALFVSDRIRLDLVAVMSAAALVLTGILTPSQALAGFGDPIVIMIASLFVVSGGMFRTGVAQRLGLWLGARRGRRRGAPDPAHHAAHGAALGHHQLHRNGGGDAAGGRDAGVARPHQPVEAAHPAGVRARCSVACSR
jgi:hypothetical protein